MKALSVKQFWASFLVIGQKTVECRSWPTPHRGELLICSSKGDWVEEIEGLDEGITFPGGMALGVVNLVDCKPMTKADLEHAWLYEEWESEALKGYAWHIEPLYQIIPVPVKGKLGLYNLDIEIQKLPDNFLDHAVYLDYMKHGRFRHPQWEPEYWQKLPK